MKTDKFIKNIAHKSGIKRKTCEKLFTALEQYIRLEISEKGEFHLPGTGTIKKHTRKASIVQNKDGSCKVYPPSTELIFIRDNADTDLAELKHSQTVHSAMTDTLGLEYSDVKKFYKTFLKLLRRSFEKGKEVRIEGLGAFGMIDGAVGFTPSRKFARNLNYPYDNLNEATTFPIIPISIRKLNDSTNSAHSMPDPTVYQENSFLTKKLAVISNDLIRLNDEINKDEEKQ